MEDGSATLMDFALAARDYQREATTAATPYLGRYLRQEGSPWRSGSTYFVELTPDGRIFLHAKDMSLSGRQIRPEIHAEILSALGVPPTVLANLVSPDPDAAAQAGGALIGILSQQPHAPFDATAPVPGLRPGIPGASGYAVVSVHVSGIPIVVLSGTARFQTGSSCDRAELPVTSQPENSSWISLSLQPRAARKADTGCITSTDTRRRYRQRRYSQGGLRPRDHQQRPAA